MTNSARSPSKLLDYLPEIYQSDPFVGQFLLPFEKILFGSADGVNFSEQGLEEKIADIHTYFHPQETPPDFLPWLSSWVALSLRADLNVQKQRTFLANTVRLYRFRGTKDNLQELLELFLEEEEKVTITDASNAEFQIGDSPLLNQIDDREKLPSRSLLGRGTYLGGGIPHFFIVRITPAQGLTQEQLDRQIEIATAIIEQEKPAHTKYRLEIIYPDTMQIGTFDPNSGEGTGSQIGIDTIFGKIPENDESILGE
ncbi:MAG: hypothetical protein F6K10_43955 [Moorea sp. SIO2B7]|nr:hypothetical protein [Moorena sp. SIO3E2]NES87723.1 hypothetical protein [Moorena sp. SIO2B7]